MAQDDASSAASPASAATAITLPTLPTDDLPPKPPTGQQQLTQLTSWPTDPRQAGATMYIVPMVWWTSLKDALRADQQPPPLTQAHFDAITVPSTDQSLIHWRGPELKPMVAESLHYLLLSEQRWRTLQHWYDVPASPSMARPVEEDIYRVLKVEAMGWELLIRKHDGELHSDEVRKIRFSPHSKTGDLVKLLARAFEAEHDRCRLWVSYTALPFSKLCKDDSPLNVEVSSSGSSFTLEVQDTEDQWPSDAAKAKKTNTWFKPSNHLAGASGSSSTYGTGGYNSTYNGGSILNNYGSYNSSSNYSSSSGYGTNTFYNSSLGSGRYGYGGTGSTYVVPGHTGLSNLGNTCFMNSALQCLSHTGPLKRYFESSDWHRELNPQNPLGCGGDLAEAFAALLRSLWSGSTSSLSPRDLKQVISRFAPQFSGAQQHDSQELTAFLLDGLHEDLNRIRQKPYVATQEAEGQEDAVAAKEAWDRHLLRNDSIIVDLFHGQFKSTLVCPVCNKVSVTFDPMMYLSLSLPELEKAVFQVLYVPADAPRGESVLYGLVMPKRTSTIFGLKQALAARVGVSASELIMTDIWRGKIYQVYEDHERTGSLRNFDVITAYHVPAASDPSMATVAVSLVFRTSDYSAWKELDMPLMLRVPLKTSVDNLYALVGRRVIPFLKPRDNNQVRSQTHGSTDEDNEDDTVTNNTSADSDAELEDTFRDTEARKGQALATAAHSNGTYGSVDTIMDGSKMAPRSNGSATAANGGQQTHGGLMSVDDEERRAGFGFGHDHELEGDAAVLQDVLSLFQLRVGEDSRPYASPKELVHGQTVELCDKDFLCVDLNEQGAARFQKELLSRQRKDESASDRPLSPSRRDAVALRDCLTRFTEREQLSKDNMWRCSVCKEDRQADKKLEIWKLPEILIIHLKRFSYNSYFRDKLSTEVDFPLEGLDLSDYVLSEEDRQNCVYDLYAVSNHMGVMGGGHYTAYCLDKDGRWFSYDDNYVSAARPGDIVSSSSYVLFYQRRKLPGTHAITGVEVSAADGKAEAAMEDEADTETAALQ